MLKIIRRYILLIGFAAFIWGFSIIDAALPARAFSELENRPLDQSPAFSWRALLNNSYTVKYEEYVNDQFAARDSWIGIKSVSESALGKLENNGVLYGADNYLFERAFSFDERQFQRNIGYIREFARMYEDCSVKFTIIPNSYAILTDKLPPSAPLIDQLSIIDECYRSFDGEPLETFDVTPALTKRGDEYIYYRTDHHWTTPGAYAAYAAYMESLGALPHPLGELDEYPTPGFYGTYYNNAKNWNAIPDTILRYDIPVNEVIIDEKPADGLYDLEMLEKHDKYAAFLHGNNGFTVIKSGRGTAGDLGATKILVFKDSYGNCFVPFLALSFNEVHVVDLRYFDDVPNILSENKYNEIYVLYNFTTIVQDTNIYKIAKKASG